MIAEAFLGIIGIALIIGFCFYVRESNKEKAKLVNALIAKDAQDLTHLTLADQTKIEPEIKSNTDLVPMDQLTEEQFDEMIAEELNNGTSN